MKQKLSQTLEGFSPVLSLLVTILIYAPKQSEHSLYIRMIQVTDKNEEKTVGQDSLISVETLKDSEKPKDNTLISSRVERFGELVILAYMSVKNETRNQEAFYITQAPDSGYHSTYETRHKGLVGSCLFHMKYIGRVYESP